MGALGDLRKRQLLRKASSLSIDKENHSPPLLSPELPSLTSKPATDCRNEPPKANLKPSGRLDERKAPVSVFPVLKKAPRKDPWCALQVFTNKCGPNFDDCNNADEIYCSSQDGSGSSQSQNEVDNAQDCALEPAKPARLPTRRSRVLAVLQQQGQSLSDLPDDPIALVNGWFSSEKRDRPIRKGSLNSLCSRSMDGSGKLPEMGGISENVKLEKRGGSFSGDGREHQDIFDKVDLMSRKRVRPDDSIKTPSGQSDWTLKTDVVFQSSVSFNWCTEVSRMDAAAILADLGKSATRSSFDDFDDPIRGLRDRFQQALMQWVFPPKSSPCHMALASKVAAKPEDRLEPYEKIELEYIKSLEEDWKEAFKSVYYSWKTRSTPYFWYRNKEFAVVFHTVDGFPEAALSRSSPGLRRALQNAGVAFNEYRSRRRVRKRPVVEFVEGEDRKGRMLDGGDEDESELALKVEGDPSIHALFDFLYTWKGPMAHLLSIKPFRNAALKYAQITASDGVRTASGETISKLHVRGAPYLLPTALDEMGRVFKYYVDRNLMAEANDDDDDGSDPGFESDNFLAPEKPRRKREDEVGYVRMTRCEVDEVSKGLHVLGKFERARQ
ncbi:hypothetical protein BJ742DRAFT_800653 [Cladochytrium replicatum]|nr:hypothetical protein BJ742DRAFT_800653 [Cladochytrium replicatum]